jgi:hypothetical protein
MSNMTITMKIPVLSAGLSLIPREVSFLTLLKWAPLNRYPGHISYSTFIKIWPLKLKTLLSLLGPLHV